MNQLKRSTPGFYLILSVGVRYRGVACDDDEEADRCESLLTGMGRWDFLPLQHRGGGVETSDLPFLELLELA